MKKPRWPLLGTVFGARRRWAAPPSWVIVGLGNPGSQYAETRHNVGFWCVDRIASEHSIALSRRHRSSITGEGEVEGHRVVLAKPRGFVNRSGTAIEYLLARYSVSPQALLVVYDDMELPPGRIRLRPEGGAGGHNGIRSVIEATGTQEFPRLRVGIGRPPAGSGAIEYVLDSMSAEERKTADEVVARVSQAVATVLTDGITVAMNRFN